MISFFNTQYTSSMAQHESMLKSSMRRPTRPGCVSSRSKQTPKGMTVAYNRLVATTNWLPKKLWI